MVALFLLTVFGLLLGASIKNRMLKAGIEANLSWSTSRRWWEVRRCCCPELVLSATYAVCALAGMGAEPPDGRVQPW